MMEWKSAIYAFYSPVPTIGYVAGRCCHIFKCLGKSCKHQVRRFLDTGDKASMGNMRKHVKSCWGEDMLSTAQEAANLDVAHKVIKGYAVNGSIVVAFEHKNKGKVTYLHRQHTKVETQYVHSLPVL